MSDFQLQKMTHNYGMRKLKSLPGVISATHVQRNKYNKDSDGKTQTVPEYIIKVRLKEGDSIIDRQVILDTHPNNIGVKEYNYITSNIFRNGK